MTYQGIDTMARITAAQAQAMRENDISFICRYLGPASWGKTITRQEAYTLLQAGISILLCYETSADRMRGGAAAGEIDGLNARNYAQDLGLPAGTAIFFACDYNVPDRDLILCESYIRNAQAALGGIYEAGAYGPERLVSFLSERGACEKFWQCVAWSNMFLPAANVRQYQWQGGPEARAMAAKLGFAVDLDAAEDLRGLWHPEEKEESHWYDEAMQWADEAGIMQDGRPNDYVTRAEAATMFMREDERIQKMIVETVKAMQPEDDKRYGGLITD